MQRLKRFCHAIFPVAASIAEPSLTPTDPVAGEMLAPARRKRLGIGAWLAIIWVVGMLVAAIVPGFSTPLAQPHAGTSARQLMSLTLPPLPIARLRGSRGDSWQIVWVSRGQTLGSLFEDFDIPAATLHKVLEQPGAKAALTRLKPGTELAFDLPVNGELRTFWQSDYYRTVNRHAHVPKMTGALKDLLDTYDGIANSPAFHLDMDLEPGDVQLISNHTILHARTAFEDWPEPEKRRHLLRLWISIPEPVPLAERLRTARSLVGVVSRAIVELMRERARGFRGGAAA